MLIWDGAGFHTAEAPEIPADVSLIRLPSYSPELNPIENLWHDLRSHYRSNRFYLDCEALMEAAVAGMVAVGADADLIKADSVRSDGRSGVENRHGRSSMIDGRAGTHDDFPDSFAHQPSSIFHHLS